MAEPKLTALPGGLDDPDDEDLWQPERVARFLGMSRHWVYKAAERGDIPYLKIGTRLRFDPSKVRAWALGREG